MQFRVLGPLKIIDDSNAEVRIRRPREQGLLAAMLLYPNQVTKTDRLMDMLWGDDRPTNGAGALRTHIWSLRRHPPLADRLRHFPGGYSVEVRSGELDLDEFRESAAMGGRTLDSGDHHAAALRLSEALQLWREPPLADLPPTPALQATVTKVLEQRRAAQDALITARLALGQHRDLLPELEAETAAYPQDERLWEYLMLARYRSGRRAEALAAYHRVRAILTEDYGIDPGPSLRRLHELMLADDPSLGQAS
jgi:DNA-binding SARP family transcriptional activator